MRPLTAAKRRWRSTSSAWIAATGRWSRSRSFHCGISRFAISTRRRGRQSPHGRWAAGGSASTTGRRAERSGIATCCGIWATTRRRSSGWSAAWTVRQPCASPSRLCRTSRPAPDGKSLSALLQAKEIDALFAPLPPRALHPVDGPIVRAFPTFRRWSRSTSGTPAVIRRST